MLTSGQIVFRDSFGIGIIIKKTVDNSYDVYFYDKKETIQVDQKLLKPISDKFVDYCLDSDYYDKYSSSTVQHAVFYSSKPKRLNYDGSIFNATIEAEYNYDVIIATSSNVTNCACNRRNCSHSFLLFSYLEGVFKSLKEEYRVIRGGIMLPDSVKHLISKVFDHYKIPIDETYSLIKEILKDLSSQLILAILEECAISFKRNENNIIELFKNLLLNDNIRGTCIANEELFIDNYYYKKLSRIISEAEEIAADPHNDNLYSDLMVRYFLFNFRYKECLLVMLNDYRIYDYGKEIFKDIVNNIPKDDEDVYEGFANHLDLEDFINDEDKALLPIFSEDKQIELIKKTESFRIDYETYHHFAKEKRRELLTKLEAGSLRNVKTIFNEEVDLKKDDPRKIAIIALNFNKDNDDYGISNYLRKIIKNLPNNKYLLNYFDHMNDHYYNFYYSNTRYFEENKTINEQELFSYFKATYLIEYDEEQDPYKFVLSYYLTDDEGDPVFAFSTDDEIFQIRKRNIECEAIDELASVVYHYVNREEAEAMEAEKAATDEKIRKALEKKRCDEMRIKMEELNASFNTREISLKNSLKKASLAYTFYFDEDVAYLNLKVGIDKKYVVKDVSTFLRSFKNNETCTYGKGLTLTHNLANFNERDAKIINYLLLKGSGDTYNKNFYLTNALTNEILRCLKDEIINIDYKEYLLKLDKISPRFIVDENHVIQNDLGAKEFHLLQLDDVLYFINEDKKQIDLISENKEESNFYFLMLEMNNLNIETIEKEFKDNIYSNFNNYIDISENLKEDYKLSILTIDAYFDYDDKKISVKSIYKIEDKEVKKENLSIASDIARLNNYEAYLESLGFEDDVIEDDSNVLAFFYMDFADMKRYCNVYLSDRIKEKSVSAFRPSVIRVEYNNNLMNAFLAGSIYSDEELENILKAIKRKRKYALLTNNRIIDLSNENANAFFETVNDLNLNQKHLNEPSEISVVNSLKAFAHEQNCDIDDYLKKMVNDIANFKEADYQLPTIEGELRTYQKEAYQWLRVLSEYKMGGVLADDMGLGKTIEIITLIKGDDKQKPSLIVCPKSLVFNWENEFKRFDPEQQVVEIYGAKNEREQCINNIQYNQKVIYITSYDSLRSDIDSYKKQFRYVVIDEAQYIKNVNAQKTITVKQLKSDLRLALTGTPIENNVIDLWSIFDFVLPGYFEALNEFKTKYSDQSRLDILAKRISPFILRRTKQNVLKDLPSKYERVLTADMSTEQRKTYDAFKMEAQKKMEGGFGVFDLLPYLTRLRQICVDPGLFVDNYQGGSGKMDLLKELIEEYLGNGHRILIFSQFVSALEVVGEELRKLNIPYYQITGATDGKERIRIADSFNNNSKESIVLISLKAGGTGLNLIGADTVIHLDPWWNISAENQASDRSHRIGQTRNVEVIKLICSNSVEQRVIELQNIKKDLIDKLIANDDKAITNASLEDIKFILD